MRRLAREIGVDVNAVQGTGAGGRITQEDVKEHARRILSSVGSAGAAGGAVVARAMAPSQPMARVVCASTWVMASGLLARRASALSDGLQ